MDLTNASLSNPFWVKLRTEMRSVLSDELKKVRANLQIVKEVQGAQDMRLKALQTDVGSLKKAVRNHSKEIHKVGVLLEDLDYRFTAGLEAL